METQGHVIKTIGTMLKGLLKLALYLLWGASRITEVFLSELNKLLKRILEKKKAD